MIPPSFTSATMLALPWLPKLALSLVAEVFSLLCTDHLCTRPYMYPNYVLDIHVQWTNMYMDKYVLDIYVLGHLCTK